MTELTQELVDEISELMLKIYDVEEYDRSDVRRALPTFIDNIAWGTYGGHLSSAIGNMKYSDIQIMRHWLDDQFIVDNYKYYQE